MGHFIISLDFELYWGVRDNRGKEYFPVLEKVPKVCEELLKLFEKYNVSCTWATVGALLADNKDALVACLPKKPSYKNEKFSPFNDFNEILALEDQLVIASDTVKKILEFRFSAIRPSKDLFEDTPILKSPSVAKITLLFPFLLKFSSANL